MTKKSTIFLLIILLAPCYVIAQTSIYGRVVNIDNEEPITKANVFIAYSTMGSSSDGDGNFELKNIPDGDYELVISHVAFSTIVLEVRVTKNMKPFDIKLTPSKKVLDEVIITEKQDRAWKRNFRKFEKMFLGTTKNARKCEILNPWVINFPKGEKGVFKAMASDLIIIRNNALGYKVDFLLENFSVKRGIVQYSGKPKYEVMTFEGAKQEKIWKKNRLLAYKGSLRHFFNALVTSSLKEEGFEIYFAKSNSKNNGFEIKAVARARDIIYPNRDGSTYNFHVSGFLKVVYTKEKEENEYVLQLNADNGRTAFSEMGKQQTTGRDWGEKEPLGAAPKNPQSSYIYLRKNNISLFSNGQPANPEHILEYGYWAWERIAELMPFDYKVE